MLALNYIAISKFKILVNLIRPQNFTTIFKCSKVSIWMIISEGFSFYTLLSWDHSIDRNPLNIKVVVKCWPWTTFHFQNVKGCWNRFEVILSPPFCRIFKRMYVAANHGDETPPNVTVMVKCWPWTTLHFQKLKCYWIWFKHSILQSFSNVQKYVYG